MAADGVVTISKKEVERIHKNVEKAWGTLLALRQEVTSALGKPAPAKKAKKAKRKAKAKPETAPEFKKEFPGTFVAPTEKVPRKPRAAKAPAGSNGAFSHEAVSPL
jgi:hypothetical protein